MIEILARAWTVCDCVCVRTNLAVENGQTPDYGFYTLIGVATKVLFCR